MHKFKGDTYYTHYHEWIILQRSSAYIGLCSFKLSQLRKIHQIAFTDNSNFLFQGTTIAMVKYYHYIVEMRMPIDGRIVQNNEVLLRERNLLLEQPENNRWIALIVPSRATKKLSHLTPKEYTEKNTVKYAA